MLPAQMRTAERCVLITPDDVFYIKMVGLKKGPVFFGPYKKTEWDPKETLKEFQSGLEKGFQVELLTSLGSQD